MVDFAIFLCYVFCCIKRVAILIVEFVIKRVSVSSWFEIHITKLALRRSLGSLFQEGTFFSLFSLFQLSFGVPFSSCFPDKNYFFAVFCFPSWHKEFYKFLY